MTDMRGLSRVKVMRLNLSRRQLELNESHLSPADRASFGQEGRATTVISLTPSARLTHCSDRPQQQKERETSTIPSCTWPCHTTHVHTHTGTHTLTPMNGCTRAHITWTHPRAHVHTHVETHSKRTHVCTHTDT